MNVIKRMKVLVRKLSRALAMLLYVEHEMSTSLKEGDVATLAIYSGHLVLSTTHKYTFR